MNKSIHFFLVLFSVLCTNHSAWSQMASAFGMGQVKSKKAMQIIEQPHDIAVCEGGNAVFSVRVSGSTEPKFQWQSSVDEGRNWSDIPRANLSVYSDLKNLTKVYHGLLLRVKVMHDNGPDLISKTASLSVDGKMTCLRQPGSLLVVEGGAVEFDVDFSAKSNTFYQWQYSPYGSGVWLDLLGENKRVLSIQQVGLDQSGGGFRVIGRSEGGCDTSISHTAYMEVIQRPTVQLNKGQDSYCGGGSSTFTVKMSGGSGREKIQWQESTDNGKLYRNLSGGTELSYTINRITEDMAGRKYRAHVILPGDIEVFTSEITITVHGAVSFHAQPRSQTICPGDVFSLETKTDFRGSDPSYQWQVSTDSVHFTDLPNQKSNTALIETKIEDRAIKYYRALVNAGDCQSMISDVARIEILSVDGFEAKVKDVEVDFGVTTATLQGVFSGNPNIYSLTWQWSANDGATWQTMMSKSSNTLTLSNISPRVEGYNLYRMKVLNTVCSRIHYSEPAKLIFK
jgi:hypothetical protein